MPISLAPSFSLATARMARPRSVRPMIQYSRPETASAPAQASSLGTAIIAGPMATVRREEAGAGEEVVLVVGVAGAVDDGALQRVAEREHAGDGNGQRHVRIDAPALLEEVHGIKGQ